MGHSVDRRPFIRGVIFLHLMRHFYCSAISAGRSGLIKGL
jgi:hypothetical protein